jgi:hypothetical protein
MNRAARAPLVRWLPALVTLALGCDRGKETPPPEQLEPSPNASIMPAPLASTQEHSTRRRDGGVVGIPADSAGRLILPEAGPPEPKPLREDTPLARDTLTTKDANGITLKGQWKWSDPPPPPGPEHDPEAYRDARDKTLLSLVIDLAPAGRMRLRLSSAAFPLPLNAEIRSRTDRFGHVLVWPDGTKYRVLPPGTLRAILSERRADVTTLVPPQLRSTDKGSLLGFPTTRLRLATQTGELVLEKANIPGTGASGDLLCRLLLELIAAQPEHTACEDGLVPLRAEYKWSRGTGLELEVDSVTRRPELPLGDVFFPPAAADFTQAELPPQASGVLLSRGDLTELRKKDVPSKEPAASGSPGEGVVLVNRTDTLRYALLDGIPIAWVRPQSEQYVIGPRTGRYTIGWRDFLGQQIEPPKPANLPARVTLGDDKRDDGAPAE